MKKIERLGEYISEYSVRNKDNEDIQVYSVTNTNGFCTEYFDKDVASKDQTNYKIVPKGYFAYNPSRINVGSIDCQSVEDRVIVSPLYVVFKADERVDNNYLLHYLKSDIGKTYINELASGSVRANLKFSILQEFPFPMIPIEEQKEKMAVIAKIDESIACCDSIIEKLDLAVKSRFIEMFGDPVSNPKSWDKYLIKDCLIRIENGKSFVCSNQEREGDSPAILKLSAATYGEYLPEENKALLDDDLFNSEVEVREGDLLFTRKNTPDLVGMAAYVYKTPPKLMMPDLIFRLVPNERINPIFLWQLINCREFRPIIRRAASGSAQSMSNISKERLGKIQIICPPISEQERLLPLMKQIDKSRFIEMFGDPVENEKGWEMIPLSELGTCKNGMNFASDEDGIEIAYLGVGDFKDNSRIDGVSGLSQISLNTMPSEKYLLKDEDIVFVRSNGSKEVVGRCLAVYPGNEKLTFSGFCIRWRKNSDKVMTDFLLQVLKTENVRILMRGRGANIQNLNQQILGKLMIPVPNMALQQSFVEFVGAIDKSKLAIYKIKKNVLGRRLAT